MKKRLLLAVIVVGALGAGALGFAAWNAASLLNSYKPEIERKVSDTLGTKVSLGEISISIFPTLGAEIAGVEVGSSGTEGTLALNQVRLDLRLMPLFSKRLEIVQLLIRSPRIEVIKTADGIRIPGVPRQKPAVTESTTPKAAPSPEAGSAPIAIALDKIEITDGAFLFRDQVAGKDYSVESISVRSSVDVSDTIRLRDIAVSGSLLGKTAFSTNIPSVTIASDGSIKLEEGDLAIAGNPLRVRGDIVASPPKREFVVMNKGFDLNSIAPLLTQYLPFIAPQSWPGQKITDMKAVYLDTTLLVNPLSLSLFGGAVNATPSVTVGETIQYSSSLQALGVQVDQALSALSGGAPSKLFGVADSVSGEVKGSVTDTPAKAFKGEFRFALSNGGIRGVNFGGATLKAVNNIPLVSGALFNHVPGAYQKALASEDTRFSSLKGVVTISSGVMTLRDTRLVGELYSIEASGSMSFAAEMNMKATITFSREFSGALAASIKEFDKVLSADGTLIVPLEIRGTLPAVTVVPNVTKLVEIAGKRMLKEKAGELLNKAIGDKVGGFLGF